MNGREIPGFYFDPEKKKYFQIQNSHTAPHRNLKYSADNVRKERKELQDRKDAAAKIKKRRKERVVRRHSHNIVTQASIDREIGLSTGSYYMHAAWPDACVGEWRHKPLEVVERPFGANIRYFDRDPNTQTLYAVHGANRIRRRRLNAPGSVPLPAVELDLNDYTESISLNEYTFEPWDELARLTSNISSLTYLPNSGALAATTHGSDRPPVVYLSDPDKDGPYVNQQFTPKNTSAIWTAAALPTNFSSSDTASNSVLATQTENLAVATSSSLLVFTRAPTGSWDSATVLNSDSDILALDWLSPTVLALGRRDGMIRLYDTRSTGSSHILTHPGPISQLCRADDTTRLVCSGLEDTLFLYDIRSRRTSSISSDDHSYRQNDELGRTRSSDGRYKKRQKRKHRKFGMSSQPVMRFQHSNPEDLDRGMDVEPRLGLVAAAQDDRHTVIKVHNLWTGKLVKNIERSQGVMDVPCLKFMEDRGDGAMSLWANWHGGVSRFCW